MKLKNILGHWKTIHIHRKWVRYYCFLAGIPWRGLIHDLSKYSPTEFFESVKYWTGHTSPISEAKNDVGISLAWQHHKGRNKHHWAYWTDNYSEGTTTHLMPEKDFTEMVCDFLAAGRAYNKNIFSYSKEYKWWLEDKEKGNKGMNEINKEMMTSILRTLEIAENPLIMHLDRSVIRTPEEMIKAGLIHSTYCQLLK